MSTLKRSMELAGENLLATLAPSHSLMPFWKVQIEKDLTAESYFVWPSHNIGRWWDAMLRLEAATGFPIPAPLEGAMLRNIQAVLDNPLGVALLIGERPAWEKNAQAGMFDTHSQREILLALVQLIKRRRSQWACRAAARMVESLDRLIKPDCTWNLDAMPDGVRPNPEKIRIDGLATTNPMRLVYGHGRLIEALLELYDATGQSGAFKLASRLAVFHVEVSTPPDGSVPPSDWVHHHSLFGAYRGLLLYGQMTRQRLYVDRVLGCYRKTVMGRINPSGFILECEGVKSGGETSSSGDAAQIALALSRLGHPECLDDAERMVRACLLPSQFTEPLKIKPTVDDGSDEHSGLAERVLGAYGGVHREPYGGKRPTTDVTAATLHTMCDIYTHIVERDTVVGGHARPLHGLRVNFHFDYEDDAIQIRTHEDERRTVSIRVRTPQHLSVRVPGWANKGSLVIESGGRRIDCPSVGPFAFIDQVETGGEITLSYDLPMRVATEQSDGRAYTLTWRGDRVLSVSPATDFFPFYGKD